MKTLLARYHLFRFAGYSRWKSFMYACNWTRRADA